MVGNSYEKIDGKIYYRIYNSKHNIWIDEQGILIINLYDLLIDHINKALGMIYDKI